jgi:hypothetical protein
MHLDWKRSDGMEIKAGTMKRSSCAMDIGMKGDVAKYDGIRKTNALDGSKEQRIYERKLEDNRHAQTKQRSRS